MSRQFNRPGGFKGTPLQGKALPRSNSSIAFGTNANVLNNGAAGSSRTTDDLPAASTPDTDNDDLWGDDDLDALLWQATQEAERNECVIKTPTKQSPPHLNRTTNRIFPRMNSDERPSVTPAENFNLRRQHLIEKESSVGIITMTNGVLGPTKEDIQKAEEKIKALEVEKETLKIETFKLKGEVSTLRRKNEEMKDDQQAEMQKRMSTMSSQQQAQKDEKNKENAEIQRLRNEVLMLQADLAKCKFNSPSGNKKNTSRISNNTTISSQNSSKSVVYSTSNNVDSPLKSTKLVQTDESSLSEKSPFVPNSDLPTQAISKEGPAQLPIKDKEEHLLDWASESVEIRQAIFQKIDKIVELRFQIILHKLELVVKYAPTEIMRKLVRHNEIKSAFPDVLDTMFQWGIDKERKKNREITGIKEPPQPVLPSLLLPGNQYYDIRNGIETSYKYGGTWGALAEVRDWLQRILKSLEGKGRFRMYEYRTLTNFWRLLFWANELWRSLLFEEENEQLVSKNKKAWAKELEGWTGLTLKCDWRDYFVVELEMEVRRFTLSILRSIVCAGYFEKNSSRYVILYRIIKDVCNKVAFRDVHNLRNVLKIVSSSLPDLMIVKHLCYKNNELNMCLARFLGENVLKVCREEKDSIAVARLYNDYANLLEALMDDKPKKCHQSKYARVLKEEEEDDNNSLGRPPLLQDSEMMDCSEIDMMAASQFACPVKYDSTSESMEVDADEEALEKELNCWLTPVNYEDPFGRKDRCQCRKSLLGTAIFVLQIVFDAWRKCYLEYEKEIERIKMLEQKELQRMEFSVTNDEDTLQPTEIIIRRENEQERLKYLQDKKLQMEKYTTVAETFFKGNTNSKEWNWSDVIHHEKKILGDGESLPSCILDFERQQDIFDLAISKGLVTMSFLQARSENLAAAIGSDAYKVYMLLLPLMRLYIDQLNFNPVNREILLGMTAECEEDHLGSAAMSFCSQDDAQNYQPDSVTNPSIEFPIPLTPLSEFCLDEGDNLESQVVEDSKRQEANKNNDEELISLCDDFADHRHQEFVVKSGPFTYRLTPN